jgi:MFS family permease
MKNNNEPDYPDPVYAWYVLLILFLAYTVAYIDRQIMALLIEPIKRDLHISDTQVSLLIGFAFVIFYTFAGIPIGRLADKKNRRVIIATGIFFWSLLTAVCGLARNFWQLFLARIGVGIGESCLSPAAYSLIADYFPKSRRSMAIGLYSSGIYVGAGLALVVGGFVIQLIANMHEVVIPVIGHLYPWQLTFFLVGIPGLIIVALLGTVKEPYRREVLNLDAGSGDSSGDLSVAETLSFFRSYWRVYSTLLLGFAMEATLSYGYFAWIPSMYIRTFGWSASHIGYVFGLIVIILGTCGIVCAGVLSDWRLSKGENDNFLRLSIFAGVCVLVFGIPAALMPNAALALTFLCPTIFFLGFHVGLAPAAVNFITPNQLRGQAMAIYIFVVALLSMSLGPTGIALITDYVFKDPQALHYSVAIFTGIFIILAIVLLWLSLKSFRASAEAILAKEAS